MATTGATRSPCPPPSAGDLAAEFARAAQQHPEFVAATTVVGASCALDRVVPLFAAAMKR